MQLAHPKVAAGVDEHSDFRSHPIRRLRRTIRMTMAIVFGDRDTATAAASATRAVRALMGDRPAAHLPADGDRFAAHGRRDPSGAAGLAPAWTQRAARAEFGALYLRLPPGPLRLASPDTPHEWGEQVISIAS